MEGGNEKKEGAFFSPSTWFIIGLWTAIILEEIVAPALTRALEAVFGIETTAPSEPIVYSENGVTGEKGESVTSLVKEETSNE